MLRLRLLAIGLTIAPLPAIADFLGIYAGVSAWFQNPGGSVQFQGTSVDVKDDLGLDGATNLFVWAALEHPIPLLPNLKLAYTGVSNSGDSTVSQNFEFGGIEWQANEDISSELELNELDLTLYYEILDNVVEADLGLAARYIDGNVEVRSRTDPGLNATATFKGVLPMLYGRAAVNLPLTGLAVAGEASGLAYGGNSFIDYRVNISYETSFVVGIEAGYRGQVLDLDDFDGINTNLDISGPYVALTGHI